MSNNNDSGLPDAYDRTIGMLDGLPDVEKTRPATLRSVSPLLGHSQTYIVQTYRQRERGDTIFLETMDKDHALRIVLPATVADAIARQREALTAKVRSKTAKRVARERKDRGELPGFMKGKLQKVK